MKLGSLNALDICVIVTALLSMVFGYFRGFIQEVFSLLVFIAAVVLAVFFYPEAARWIVTYVDIPSAAAFTGFLAIFVAVLVVGTIVVYFIKKLVDFQPLKTIDRIMGGAFGLIRGVALAGVIVFGFMAFPVEDRMLLESATSPWLTRMVKEVFRFCPEKWRTRFPEVEKWKGDHDRQKNNPTGRRI